MTAAGSRGDVQPCVALGLGLQEAGHGVTLASWEPYRGMAERRGLAFRPVAGPSPDELMAALLEAGRNPLRYASSFRPVLRPHVERGLRDCLAACQGADAVVYTPLGFAGFLAAEHLGVFSMGAVVEPLFVRGGSYPSAVLGESPRIPALGGLYNRLSHRAVEQMYWRTVRPLISGAAQRLGLAPVPVLRSPVAGIHRRRRPLLLGWSRHVLPPDLRHEARMPTTGYWTLDPDRDWHPPDNLRAFLAAGPPPAALALGSMTGIETAGIERLVSLTARALRRAGRRGILLSDHAEIDGALPENVIRVGGEIPYDWLFPRTAVAVHHGGAGTLAAALKAGVPSVTIPLLPDQAFWGRRAADLGVGSPPMPPKKLSAEALAAAVERSASDGGVRGRCHALSAKLATEDGVSRAVDAFGRHAMPGS